MSVTFVVQRRGKHLRTQKMQRLTIRTICERSSETIILVSSGGHSKAPDTLVPPPNGITQILCLHDNSTTFTTSL